jgi:hypothetical protein
MCAAGDARALIASHSESVMFIERVKSSFSLKTTGYVAMAVLCIAGMWLLPADMNFKIAFSILCFGAFFDLVSLFYHVCTIVTGKYMSGFPVVGLIFYGLFLLTAQTPLVARHETVLTRVLLYKIVDALILLAFHLCCHLPMRLQKSRESYD